MAKKYKLSLQDCLVMRDTLPGNGKIEQMKIVKRLAAVLELTDEEEDTIDYMELGLCERCGYKVHTGRFRWNADKAEAQSKVVEISEAAQDQLVKAMRKAEDEEAMTPSHVGLWDLFVLNKNIEDYLVTEAESPKEGE